MKKKDISMHIRMPEIILIASLLLVGLLSLFIINTFKTRGDVAHVTVDGELYAEYSLSVDAEYKIGNTNTIVIEGGYAFMKSAECPDKTCVHTGKISSVGERIVCLPNKVMVEIRGGGGQ